MQPTVCVVLHVQGVGVQHIIEHFKECQGVFVLADEESTLVPPIVTVPKNIEFPFCIMRVPDETHEEFAQTGSVKEKAQIAYRSVTEYRAIVCSTTEAVRIRCREVARTPWYIELYRAPNGTVLRNTFSIPGYSNGTAHVADIFWYCGKGTQLQITLQPGWTGICAPVLLTGTLVVISLAHKPIRHKRERVCVNALEKSVVQSPRCIQARTVI